MKRINFDNNDISWLKDNYQKVSNGECARKLNCSISTLLRLIKQLGFSSPRVATKTWDGERIHTIINLYIQERIPISKIAQQFHTHTQVISNILKNNHVTLQQTRFTPKEEREMIEAYLSKQFSLGDLLDKFHTTSPTFKRILKKHGIPFTLLYHTTPSLEVENKIASMYINGISMSTITKRLNIPYQRVRKVLENAGIKARTRNGNFWLNYSPELVANILDLNNNHNKNVFDIAKILELDYGTVTRIFNKQNIIPKRYRKSIFLSLSNEQKNEVKQVFKNIGSILGTARVLGLGECIVVRTLKELNLYQPTSFYSYNRHYFDIINSHDKAYILGLLITDGCNSPDSGRIDLVLKRDDEDLVKQVNQFLTTDKPVFYRQYKKASYCGLTINNVHMSNRLVELGLPQAKTFKIKPEIWMTNEFSSSAILGMMDGDGSIYKKIHRRKTFPEPRKEFCFSFIGLKCICEMMQSIFKKRLNVNSTVSSHSKYKNDINKPLCTVRIYGNRQTKTVLDWLYSQSPIRMKRKHDRYLELCEYVQLPKRKNQFC